MMFRSNNVEPIFNHLILVEILLKRRLFTATAILLRLNAMYAEFLVL